MSSMPLIPTWPMPSTVTQIAATQPPPKYGTSFAFDFEAGDFVLDGAGRVQTTNGLASWAIWCAKAALTDRYAFLAYSNQYGCETARITRATSHALAETEAQQVIREALLADARTASVDGFTFTWSGDALTIGFTITPVVGQPQPVSVSLTP